MLFIVLMLVGCSTASTIQRADQSKSAFDDAVYEGEEYNVNEDVPGSIKYRIFHQASTGFTSVQSVRVSATKRADHFCEKKSKIMQVIKEHTSEPPHILGNFPRIEIIFTCIDNQKIDKDLDIADDRYKRLREIKSLLDDGVITQHEFDAEKVKILSE